MKSIDLKNSIDALKALRAEMHEERGTSVIERLDEVILQLEECLDAANEDAEVPEKVRYQALEILADALRLMTNLSEIIHLWMGIS